MKNKNDKNKIQQRQITVTEFSDGTFELDGVAWKLEVSKFEIDQAFSEWRKGNLKENSHFDNRLPKLLTEPNNNIDIELDDEEN